MVELRQRGIDESSEPETLRRIVIALDEPEMNASGRSTMNKWIKITAIGALLIGAGFFLGRTCSRFDQALPLLLSPARESLDLLIWFLLAVGVALICAELAAALVRPLWLGVGLFALSALAILLSCPITLFGALVALVYLLGSVLYLWRAARELENRIRFSVHALAEQEGILLTVLALIACAHMYIGSMRHIEREGLSAPQGFVEVYGAWMEQQVAEQVPPQDREQALAEFRREFQAQTEGMFNSLVERYETWIPLAIGVGFFMMLKGIFSILSWIPALILSLVFSVLAALKLTKVVTKAQEVQRISL
jgi:membrane protein implicated in regulation of membrane protease activity